MKRSSSEGEMSSLVIRESDLQVWGVKKGGMRSPIMFLYKYLKIRTLRSAFEETTAIVFIRPGNGAPPRSGRGIPPGQPGGAAAPPSALQLYRQCGLWKRPVITHRVIPLWRDDEYHLWHGPTPPG